MKKRRRKPAVKGIHQREGLEGRKATQSKLFVAVSHIPNAGFGVFSFVDIAKNTCIGQLDGKIGSPSAGNDPYVEFVLSKNKGEMSVPVMTHRLELTQSD